MSKKKSESIDTGFFGITFEKSELVIIGAKPGVGKSALAYSIFRNIAVENGIPAAVITTGTFFGNQLMQRLLSYESEIKYHKLQKGLLNEKDVEKLNRAIQKLKESPIFVEDFPNGSFNQIEQAVEKLVAENHIKILFIDSYEFLDEVVKGNLPMSKVFLQYKNLAQLQNILVAVLMDLPANCELSSLNMFRNDVAVTRIVDSYIFLDREIINDYERIPDTKAKLLFCRGNQFCEYEVKLEDGRVLCR